MIPRISGADTSSQPDVYGNAGKRQRRDDQLPRALRQHDGGRRAAHGARGVGYRRRYLRLPSTALRRGRTPTRRRGTPLPVPAPTRSPLGAACSRKPRSGRCPPPRRRLTRPSPAAYFHHPRFSSSANQPSAPAETKTIFQTLYDRGIDVALSGHAHDYERFAPMNPSRQVDNTKGVRSFIVGTGGGASTRWERRFTVARSSGAATASSR